MSNPTHGVVYAPYVAIYRSTSPTPDDADIREKLGITGHAGVWFTRSLEHVTFDLPESDPSLLLKFKLTELKPINPDYYAKGLVAAFGSGQVPIHNS